MAIVKKTGKTSAARKRLFLKAFARCGVVERAARAAGVTHQAVAKWRKNEKFEALFQEAAEAAIQVLEAEAFRRSHDGVLEPVFYHGVKCGAVRRYSDTLLIFLLKARRPKVYRERHEITGADGGPLEVIDARESLERKLARLAATGTAAGVSGEPDGGGKPGPAL